MTHINPKTEFVARILLTIMVLLNAAVPVTALAKPADITSDLTSSELNTPLTELPKQQSIQYQPNQTLPVPNRFSPNPDEPQPVTPEKDPIEFSISAAHGEISTNRTVTVKVSVRNNSLETINNLTYYDKLETGLDFGTSPDPSVNYNFLTGTVSNSAGSLNPGEEVNFSYTFDVTDNFAGKLAIHNGEIEYDLLNGETHAQTTSLGFADSSPLIDSNALIIVPDQTGDGWDSAGRYSLYMGPDVLTQEAVVSITPADIPGNSPDLQFNLNLIETTTPTSALGGDLNEQDLTLKKEVETNFNKPAYLEINLDGIADLNNLPGGMEPYVATYDETSKVWVKVPIVNQNADTNSVTVPAAHFSTWGAGLGNSLPQNGANVLLFDQPYTSLFTGSARYSIPIWTPAGRAGMTPDVSLSYSSATVDGVLGDVQAPWVGVGWNIDGTEIVRKIVTNENGYGYANSFALTLNGTMYELLKDPLHPNRFYTKQGSFLYIERHNYDQGNEEIVANNFKLGNTSSTDLLPQNDTGEWWEVVTTDGTHYRLGWNKDSEQLALMYGYSCKTANPCNSPSGAYQTLGYAGKADNQVALRWRVDRITDAHGNFMTYTYDEKAPTALVPSNRDSYLETISYGGFNNGQESLTSAYQIKFETAIRTTDVPTSFNIWDNLDTKYLSHILICSLACDSSGQVVRTYSLGYTNATVPNANGSLTLSTINMSGGGYTDNGQTIPAITAPTISFTYQNLDNRAVTGTADKFTYPRLQSIDNGTGGVVTYTLETDENRGTNSWYNYRVKQVQVNNGLGIAAAQSYTYSTPVYTGSGNLGDLIGYTTSSENQLDYNNGKAVLLETRHQFGTQGLDTGYELQTEWLSGTKVLKKTTNTYVTDNSKAPFSGWNYRYLYRTTNYVNSGSSLITTSSSTFLHDPSTGNLLQQTDYLGLSTYRKTYYEYLINTNPFYYVLDKASRSLVVDAFNNILSDTRFHYDEKINTAPTFGDLTLTQNFTGSNPNNPNEVVNTGTHYDVYGNPDQNIQYTAYGSVNIAPSGGTQETLTTYDSVFHIFPVNQFNPGYISTDNLSGQVSETKYLTKLGVPYQVTDANGWITTTKYDGFGRQTSIRVPGITDNDAVAYIYPTPNGTGKISAPYSVEMKILDTPAGTNVSRSVWGIYDGLGRQIQTQVLSGFQGQLLITDIEFNPQGAVSRQSSPYIYSGLGGNLVPQTWNQVTSTTYDALGRPIQVVQPGGITTQTSYDGTTTITLDPNGNKTERIADGLGRLTHVREYSDENTVYATTSYVNDPLNRLVKVTDAQSNVTTLSYDWLGRKIGMDDPDMGIWAYGYNPTGTLAKQTDARGQVLDFTYDFLNRLETKSGPGIDVHYGYGNTIGSYGFRKSMTDQSGATLWSYDNFGRTVNEVRAIADTNVVQSMTTTTDWLGRTLSVQYPDNEILTYTYDALGRPDQLNSSQTTPTLVDLTYNVLGQITSQALGNGITITNTYNLTDNRLASKYATGGIINFAYTYDSNGNILSINDSKLNETHTYSYDFLNRLKTVEAVTTNTTTIKYSQEFDYDKVGNILDVNDWTTPTPVAMRNSDPDSSFSPVVYRPVLSNSSHLAAPAYQQGPTSTPTNAPDLLFKDDFETNNFTKWGSTVTDSGNLSTSTNVAMYGTYGMQALINDLNTIYATDFSPAAEHTYYARFYFDPNTISIPSGQGFGFFTASSNTGSCLRIMLNNVNGVYNLQAQAMNDASSWIAGQNIPTTDAIQEIEVEYSVSSAVNSNDGYVKLWLNDTLVDTVSGVDNDTRVVDTVSLGAVNSIDTGTSGTIYFDEFESRKNSHIGPILINTSTPTVTSTPTITYTPTITLTPSKTSTPTTTFTPSKTSTPTTTFTPSKTSTPTSTYTPSKTSTPTSTFTPSKTSTPTSTPSFTPSFVSTPTMFMANDLSAYWSFDNVSGTSVNDVAPIGTPNTATLGGGPVIETSGAKGSSIYFNGTDSTIDYATIADHVDIKTNGSFTISAWVNPASVVTSKTQYIVQKGAAAMDYGLITVSTQGTATPTANPGNTNLNGSLAFKIGDLTPNTIYGPILPVNTWSMITGVYDATAKQMRLYVNGELVAAQVVTGTLSMSTTQLTFSSPSSYGFDGRLDEVRFYKRALTDTEVQASLSIFSTPTPQAFTATPTVVTATPNITPIPLSDQPWGTGNDGDITISTPFNINSDKSNNSRTCADGVAFNITQLSDMVAVLNANPTSTCLAVGDEILLVQLSTTNATGYNAGAYEFLRVAAVNGANVTFTTPKTKWYGANWRSDANIGIGTGQTRVMLMRVPNYNNLTVNGTLKASAFDGNKNGVVVFRVKGVLNGTGTISADQLGFTNGSGYGAGTTGGGSAGGGGGSYGSLGTSGTLGMYGEVSLTSIFLGSSGGDAGNTAYTGSCGADNHACSQTLTGPQGAAGGGIVLFSAQNFTGFTGSVTANGQDYRARFMTYDRGGSEVYSGVSGAGSGGSIRIEGMNVNLNSVLVNGGANGSGGGAGGSGRIAIYYIGSKSITSSNVTPYFGQIGETPVIYTETPTPIALFDSIGNFGSGLDGNLSVSAGQTINLSTYNSNSHTCGDGGDAVSYSVTTLSDSSAVLSTSVGEKCLQAGDELLLIQLSGSGANKGTYEFLRVGGVSGNIVYFTIPKTKWYGANTGDDTNIGTGTGQTRVMLMRVPNYNNLTVNGTLKTSAFDGNKNGVVVFRVKGILSGTGTISADQLGFLWWKWIRCRTTGGGSTGGGGGSYGSLGTNGTLGIYGEASLAGIFLGSSGGDAGNTTYTGSCGADNHACSQTLAGPQGSAGGGIVLFSAQSFTGFTGSVTAKGEPYRPSTMTYDRGGSPVYSAVSGAGSGGSIRIEGMNVSLNSVLVNGGASGTGGGAGGSGRIAIYYIDSQTITSTNVTPYFSQLGMTGSTSTPTLTPTITATPAFDNHTVSLLHLDGTDQAKVFPDLTGKTWNSVGDAQIDTAQSKFGGASALFDGTGDYLNTADHDDFAFGSGDFTIDFWVRFNALPASGNYAMLYEQIESTQNYNYIYYRNNYGGLTGLTVVMKNGGTDVFATTTSNWTAATNTWYHIAVVRNGNTGKIYIDGVEKGSVAVTGSAANVNANVHLGYNTFNSNYGLNGWLDEVR
ncbi:MAG: LamG-like jellyroll fold domain-containing protein, partial [Anaerolineales bacterium]